MSSCTRGCPSARTSSRASPAAATGRRCCSCSHTDAVLADAAEWAADPFGRANCASGEVWGRGALDMKGQVAASAVAIASLAREGFEPAGDLIFAADRRRGGRRRLRRAVALRDASRRGALPTTLINEGAGDRLELGGKPFYLCAAAEKMSAPFLLRVRGRSGHASMPGIADNALVKAAPLITALGAYVPEPRLTPEVEALLEAVTGGAAPRRRRRRSTAARAIGDLCRGDSSSRCSSLTLSPTMIEASQKRNVIPAVCDVTVDSRLLPGHDAGRRSRRSCAACSATGDYELEWLEAHGGTRSPIESPLWDAVDVLGRRASSRAPAPAPDLRRRLHRQPLVARGVRHRRLRLLPVARDDGGARRAARSTRRTSGSRSTTSSSACASSATPPGRSVDLRNSTLSR